MNADRIRRLLTHMHYYEQFSSTYSIVLLYIISITKTFAWFKLVNVGLEKKKMVQRNYVSNKSFVVKNQALTSKFINCFQTV